MAKRLRGVKRDGAGPSSAPDPQDGEGGDVDGDVSETAKHDTDVTDGDEEQDPGAVTEASQAVTEAVTEQ